MEPKMDKKTQKEHDKFKTQESQALTDIRLELKLSQDEMASKLGVSRQQYQKYEYGKLPLPLEKGLYICKKWNYPIDTIYSTNAYDCRDKFKVDFRDLLSIDGENIILSIPISYWEYLNEYKKIDETSDLTDDERFIRHKELEGKYEKDERTETRKIRLPISDFTAFIMGIPYVPSTSDMKFEKPTEEEIEKVRELFEHFSNPD